MARQITINQLSAKDMLNNEDFFVVCNSTATAKRENIDIRYQTNIINFENLKSASQLFNRIQQLNINNIITYITEENKDKLAQYARGIKTPIVNYGGVDFASTGDSVEPESEEGE